MSGLGELGGLEQFGPGYSGQVSQQDIDQYDLVAVMNPSVDGSWIGTYSGTGPVGGGAAVVKNILMDVPRNVKYATNGITNGTYGGTFTVNWLDQFGVAITEKVTIGTAVNGGTTYGTAIAHKFLSGTFQPVASAGTFIGTASIGAGTSPTSNWFGLLTKIAATGDIKCVRWVNNGTVTGIGGGSLLGTLVSVANSAFQGTSGVAITDSYTVVLKPTYDNEGKGIMSGL
jgi:hypothetical protein